VRSATPSGRVSLRQGRRLDLHQHDAVYRTAASLFGHVGLRNNILVTLSFLVVILLAFPSPSPLWT
jgi:hypothetical protein